MVRLKQYKLTELPADPESNSIYFIQDGSKFDLYVTGIDGTVYPMDLPTGGSGASGEPPAIYVAYGDATPSEIYVASTNQIITSLTLVVTTTFNGVGAKIAIGTTLEPELLLAEDESDLSIIASFESDPEVQISAGTSIKAFITPGAGASQGNCIILIEYAEA